MKSTLMLGAAIILAAATDRPRMPTGTDGALTDANAVAIFDAAKPRMSRPVSLPRRKGSSAETRNLGSQFATDHKALRQQCRDLAKRLNIVAALPEGDQGATDHTRAMADLRAKSGAAFDQAYAAHEVMYHQTVIDNVTQTLLPRFRMRNSNRFCRTPRRRSRLTCRLRKISRRRWQLIHGGGP